MNIPMHLLRNEPNVLTFWMGGVVASQIKATFTRNHQSEEHVCSQPISKGIGEGLFCIPMTAEELTGHSIQLYLQGPDKERRIKIPIGLVERED